MNELIVCATDFSPEAETALAWAATMARRDGGHVDLVHVLPPGNEDRRLLVFDTVQFDAEQVRAATDRLREAARRAAAEFGVSIRPQNLRGEFHEGILKHAREEEARMIVMGAGGLGAVDRLVLGSVAERTLRSADRPVVLVPRQCSFAVWSAAPGVTPARAARVVAALGNGEDAAIVRFVSGLRREAPCDVTFLHLYWPIGEYARLGLNGRRDLFAPDPDVVKNLEPALRVKTNSLPGSGTANLEIRPAWGEPASNLLVAVEDREADLLVVGAHERKGIAGIFTSSIAQRLARHARYVPIAVVPADHTTVKPSGLPRLHTVLAVTDLSPLGNSAIPHAYSLVRGAAGVVELCHVHERSLPTPAYAYDSPDGKISQIELARVLKDLRGLVPAEAQSLGIASHASVIDGGKPAEAIVQASERLDVDAIVLASHGRGGLARTVLGSVASEVVQRARRPVYVVRAK
jgi:nucleotide-binding universal stress UspA family protein